MQMETMKSLPSTLASLQRDIYWLHDKGDFHQLAEVASTLFQHLGVESQKATLAGDLISEAYKLADEANNAFVRNDLSEEAELYKQAMEKLERAELAMRGETRAAYYQVRWWRSFRHKNIAAAAWFLFMQNLSGKTTSCLAVAFKATYYLAMVGFAHNRRSKDDVHRHASCYWELMLQRNLRCCAFLG